MEGALWGRIGPRTCTGQVDGKVGNGIDASALLFHQTKHGEPSISLLMHNREHQEAAPAHVPHRGTLAQAARGLSRGQPGQPSRARLRRQAGRCWCTSRSPSLFLFLRYAILPNIDYYKGDIERAASRALGSQVSIARIYASWHGLRPNLFLGDVTLRDAPGPPGAGAAERVGHGVVVERAGRRPALRVARNHPSRTGRAPRPPTASCTWPACC